ncbi:uncharacterized protein LOC125027725 [Penaeus chinensis]|uniref:uncharacterized protein LOC125027725 n=1 Tax=Penaeus chinensis TaxID=139456 RepID=UPI001FB75AE2|nr:uncharacterized protein LOC125027725 [Penaeus chinensis]XP_047472782.1 uncharacterized protein LOC125027725 [Penaeus chinensis]
MAEFKIYSCLQCDAIFTRSCKLEAHTKSHLQESDSYESSDYEGPSIELSAKRYKNRRSRAERATPYDFRSGDALENEVDEPPVDRYPAPPSPKPLVIDFSPHWDRRAPIDRDRPVEPSLPRLRFRNCRNEKNFLARWERDADANYVCSVCKQVFLRLSYLKIHIRVHTGFRPYVCDVCKKAFTQSSALQSHTRIHTGEKPYQCKICKKRFKESSKVTRHMRVHTGEKPYRCKLCGKSFSQSGSLKIHSKQHDRFISNGDKGKKKNCTTRLGQCTREFRLRKDLTDTSLQSEEEEPQVSATECKDDLKNKIDQMPETMSEKEKEDENLNNQDSVIWLVENKPETKTDNGLTPFLPGPCEADNALDIKQSPTVCEEYTNVPAETPRPEYEINVSAELESKANGSPLCDSITDEGTDGDREGNATSKGMKKILLKHTGKEACMPRKKWKRKRLTARPKKTKRGKREISVSINQTLDKLVKEASENSASRGNPDNPKVPTPSTQHIENGARLTTSLAEDGGHQNTHEETPEVKEKSQYLFQHAEMRRNVQKSDEHSEAGTVQTKEKTQECTAAHMYERSPQLTSLLNIKLYKPALSRTSSTAFPSFSEQVLSHSTLTPENIPVLSSKTAPARHQSTSRITEHMKWESDNDQYPLDLSKHKAARSSRQHKPEPSKVGDEAHRKGKTPEKADEKSHNEEAEKDMLTQDTFQTFSQRLSVNTRSKTQGYRSLNRRVQRKPKKLDEQTLNEPHRKSKQTDKIRLEHPVGDAVKMLPRKPIGMGQNFFRASPSLKDHATETNHDTEQTKNLSTKSAQRKSSRQTDQGLPKSGKPKKGNRKHRVKISEKPNKRTNERVCKKSLIDVILYQVPREEKSLEEYLHADNDIHNKEALSRESRKTTEHGKGKKSDRCEHEGSKVYPEQHLNREAARASEEDIPQDLSWRMPAQERVSEGTLFYASNDDISCVEVVVRTSSDNKVEAVFKEEDVKYESGLEPHEISTAELPYNTYNNLCEIEIPAMESTASTSYMYDERAYSTVYLTQEEPSQREDASTLYTVQESSAHSSYSEHLMVASHSIGSGVPYPQPCAHLGFNEQVIAANHSISNGDPFSHLGAHSNYCEHMISASHNISGGVPYPCAGVPSPYPGAHTSYSEHLISASHNLFSGVPYPQLEDQVYQERINTPPSYPSYNFVCHYYAVCQPYDHY